MINSKTLLKTALLGTIITLGSFGAAEAGCLVTKEDVVVTTRALVPVNANGDCMPCDVPAKAATPASAAAAIQASTTTVYFDFDSAVLSPSAKKVLTVLRHKLSKTKGAEITILGFADRLGNADYNERLALQRAENVRKFLAAHGLNAKKSVRSLGDTVPRADCSNTLPRAELIACLRVDRRVEIEVR